MSTCEEGPNWSEIEGECPEQENELNPIYTGNYQLGRQEYVDEEEEEEETEEETVEGDRVVEEGPKRVREEEWNEDEDINRNARAKGIKASFKNQ